MVEIAVCIECGLGETGLGIGYVDLDPTGGIECNGVAGNGTPTAGRGLRLKVTEGVCNGIEIDGSGNVTVQPSGAFVTAAGIEGTTLSVNTTTPNCQMAVSNTNNCATLNYLFTVEFNIQTDEAAEQVEGIGSYRINGGAWNDIYNIVAQTPTTAPFTFCPSLQTLAAGATAIWDVKFWNGAGSVTIDSWAIRTAAWGAYA